MIELIEGYTPEDYRVIKHMRREAFAYCDRLTGKVAKFRLAKDTTGDLELWGCGNNPIIPEWVYELAYEVGAEYEEKEKGQ